MPTALLRRIVSARSPALHSDAELLAILGLDGEHYARRAGELRAACARLARKIRDDQLRIVGFVPSDERVAIPPLLIHLGLALCDLTGGTAAVVDANVRYPGLPPPETPCVGETVFSTRWLRGSLALLSPPHAEHAGQVVPQLARALLEGGELFGHVLVDLTGFDLIGEHATAAACMDAVAVVGRVHETRESALVRLAELMPRGRFLGVLLVG